jgi:hypothetical protein
MRINVSFAEKTGDLAMNLTHVHDLLKDSEISQAVKW